MDIMEAIKYFTFLLCVICIMIVQDEVVKDRKKPRKNILLKSYSRATKLKHKSNCHVNITTATIRIIDRILH